jgi:RNA polymerase sigma-70 factor (ECF subfamily)
MYRTATRLLHDRDDAEDAVQDALHKGWRSLDRFDGSQQMKSWLFRILTNTCIDQLRSRNRKLGTLEDVSTLEVDRREAYGPRIGDLPPEETLANLELQRLIDTEIGRLSPDQQAVVQFVIVEKMSYEEAAGILELPIGTVRSRLSRARAQLCHNLAEVLDDQIESKRERGTAPAKMVMR